MTHPITMKSWDDPETRKKIIQFEISASILREVRDQRRLDELVALINGSGSMWTRVMALAELGRVFDNTHDGDKAQVIDADFVEVVAPRELGPPS